MADSNKTYKTWNGKNIDGRSYVGDPNLIKETKREEDALMKYIVGVDTFSADDLQPDVDYQ